MVWAAIAEIVSTIPPMRSERLDSSPIAAPACWEASATWRIASDAWPTASTPSSASLRARSAASAVTSALSALALAAREASWTALRVFSTIRTWRSAPCATSLTAEAISPTARPASSEA